MGTGMTYRALELPDMLRKYDVEPVLVAGWETRGKDFPVQPRGALRHWTADGPAIGIPSLRILTFGRSDLPGPLCEVGQERAPADRDDRAFVVASGKANHAGAGNWNGMTSNYHLLGLEIEWMGPTEVFSDRRREVSERIMAALLDCTTGGDDDVAEHREYALPKGRKIDTNLDGNVLRQRMVILRSGGAPTPTPPPASPVDEEDNDMQLPALIVASDAATGTWFVTDGITKQHLKNKTHATLLINQGKAKAAAGTGDMTNPEATKPHIWPKAAMDSIRLVGSAP